MASVKVLVVDDSALVRKVLSDLLSQDRQIEVVGTAADGAFAMRKIHELQPDVITLDVEMRQVGGLEFLKQMMSEKPTPTIMVSAHTQKGAEVTLKALELGAVDFVAKPQAGGPMGLAEVGDELAAKVKVAARSKIRQVTRIAAKSPAAVTPRKPAPLPRAAAGKGRFDLIAIGASTGGTEALKAVLTRLRPDCPGVVVVQHMPVGFTTAFANRLNGLCEIEVREAAQGDTVAAGTALIAPGHSHLKVHKSGLKLVADLDQGPPVNRHRPSVEPMFLSAAKYVGGRCIGIMLTGMGADGAKAMVQLKVAGAYTIAQSEDSCVVFGMPKEAIAAGAIKDIVHLDKIADKIYSVIRNGN